MGSVPPPPVGPNDMAETTSGGCPRGHCRFAAEHPTGRSATRRLARVRRAATSRPRDRASRPHRTPRCATAPDHPARRNRMVRTDCSETRWRAARRSKLFGRGASAVRLPVPARRRRRHHHIVIASRARYPSSFVRSSPLHTPLPSSVTHAPYLNLSVTAKKSSRPSPFRRESSRTRGPKPSPRRDSRREPNPSPSPSPDSAPPAF